MTPPDFTQVIDGARHLAQLVNVLQPVLSILAQVGVDGLTSAVNAFVSGGADLAAIRSEMSAMRHDLTERVKALGEADEAFRGALRGLEIRVTALEKLHP